MTDESGWGPTDLGNGWTIGPRDEPDFVAIVPPDQVDRITAAADTAGVADLVTIVGSPVCPADQMILIDTKGLETDFRASMQRLHRTLFH